MCVICVKPKGVKMPSYDMLLAMAQANPDGCGFVSTRHSCKSLDFDEFYEHLRHVRKDENCIIHFRWATHGSVKLTNCHPFHSNGVYFAHNGILRINPIGDMTDSETAFKTRIMPKVEQYGLNSLEVKREIESIIGGSKFAIMHQNTLNLYGDFKALDGCYYSNFNFLYNLRRHVI